MTIRHLASPDEVLSTNFSSFFSAFILLVLASAIATQPAAADSVIESPPSDPWQIWNAIYETRADTVIQSAKVTYLRRVSARSSTTGEMHEFPLSLEHYTAQGKHYLVEATQYPASPDLPLEQIDLAALEPSSRTTYFWNGKELVTMGNDVQGEPAVTISEAPARVPDFMSFGRAPDRMPSPEAWKTSLRSMGKELTVSEERAGGRTLLVLRVGREDEPGYFLDLSIDPLLDNAIVSSRTMLGGILIIEERYEDFSKFDGLYLPRRVTRTNFRIDPSFLSSSVSSREEFRLVGTARLNQEFGADDLTRPVPSGADRFEKPVAELNPAGKRG